MSRYTYILLLPLLFLFGCTDSDRPSDMPKLYPCTVSVTQGGRPLEGAIVTFHSDVEQKYRPVTFEHNTMTTRRSFLKMSALFGTAAVSFPVQ